MRRITGSIAPTLVMLMLAGVSFAQQWQGNSNATDPIGRTGNVGIGTTSPGYTLDVAGTINAKGMIFEDYVGSHINRDGALYRYNGQAYLTTDDNFFIRDTASSGLINLRPDGNTYFNNNGNIGIGTTSPSYKLEVYGDLLAGSNGGNLWIGQTGDRIRIDTDSNSGYLNYQSGIRAIDFDSDEVWLHGLDMYIGASGNVGIGTASPGEKLYVSGGNIGLDLNDGGGLKIGSQARFGVDNSNQATIRMGTGGLRIMNNAQTYVPVTIKDGNYQNALYIEATGNVGIGTTSPATKLTVKGTITAEEVVVEAVGADFVFKPDYPLMPLRDLQRHIRQQGRLPGLPAAAEMETKGMRLGRMETKLLQKIEELTLYTIEQENRLNKQQDLITALQQTLTQLKHENVSLPR